MASIYGLVHPETGELRYIGKANHPAKRLTSHLRDARRRHTPVYRWILKLGKAPDMVVLDENCADWETSERQLIIRARRQGHRLLNVAEGGDEPFCSHEVRSRNAHALNARLAADPLLARVRELNRALSQAHRAGRLSERAKVHLRYAAAKRPDLFGRWATI